jgi:hypothetical protein
MFVPHVNVPSRHGGPGRRPGGRRPAAAIVGSVAATAAGAVVASGLHGHVHGGPMVAGLLLAAVAVVGGFVLARVIGRSGRV